MKIIAEILSIVILLAGMASCTKTDRLYDDDMTEIALRPVMSVMPKAPVTGTEYPAGASFGVVACYSSEYGDGQEWTEPSSEPLLYIDNREFSKSGDTFSGDPACYWPLSGSLVFAGYSPYDAKKESITFDPDTKTLTITGFESNGQTDLMYFLPELLNGNLVGINNGASSVPVAFSHALSLVEFNVKGVDHDETVKLRSITFKNIPQKGNLAADASGCSWSDPSSTGDLNVFPSDDDNDDGEILSSADPVTATILIIPGSAVDIELGYYAIGVSTHEKTGTIRPGDAVTEWVAGKKYIYNLTIRSGIIIIDSLSVYDYPEIDGPDTEI